MRPSPPREPSRGRPQPAAGGRRVVQSTDAAMPDARTLPADALLVWDHVAAGPAPEHKPYPKAAEAPAPAEDQADLEELWASVGRPERPAPQQFSPRNKKRVAVTVEPGLHGADPMPSRPAGRRRASHSADAHLQAEPDRPAPPLERQFSARNKKRVALELDAGTPGADPMPGAGAQRAVPDDLMRLWDAVGHPGAAAGAGPPAPAPAPRQFSPRNKKRVALELDPSAAGADPMPGVGLAGDARAVPEDLHRLWHHVEHPARPLERQFSARNKKRVAVDVEAAAGADPMPGVGLGDQRAVPDDLLQLWQAVEHPGAPGSPEADPRVEPEPTEEPSRLNRKGVTVSVPDGGLGADPLPSLGSPRLAPPRVEAREPPGPARQQCAGSAVLSTLLGYRAAPSLPGPMGARLLALAREAPPERSARDAEAAAALERKRAEAVAARERGWRLREEIAIAQAREAFEARVEAKARPMRESADLRLRAQQTGAAARSQQRVRNAELEARRALSVAEHERRARKKADTDEVVRHGAVLEARDRRETRLIKARRARLADFRAKARMRADARRTAAALEAKRERAIAARERERSLRAL